MVMGGRYKYVLPQPTEKWLLKIHKLTCCSFVVSRYCGVNYRPYKLGAKKWNELGKTVDLMLRMCDPIFGTIRAVFMGSGFFVAKGIKAL